MRTNKLVVNFYVTHVVVSTLEIKTGCPLCRNPGNPDRGSLEVEFHLLGSINNKEQPVHRSSTRQPLAFLWLEAGKEWKPQGRRAGMNGMRAACEQQWSWWLLHWVEGRGGQLPCPTAAQQMGSPLLGCLTELTWRAFRRLNRASRVTPGNSVRCNGWLGIGDARPAEVGIQDEQWG